MDQDPTLHEAPTPVGRRVMLQGAALTGVAACLAACGKDSGDSAGSDAHLPDRRLAGVDSSSGSSPTQSEPSTAGRDADIPVDGGMIVGRTSCRHPARGRALQGLHRHLHPCGLRRSSGVSDGVIHLSPATVRRTPPPTDR